MIRKIKNFHHLVKAIVGNAFLSGPAKDLKIIGVTGTDGKTTTASMINHILFVAGYKTALVSTIGAFINGKDSDTGLHVTTPSSFQLLRYIKEAKAQGVEYIVLEVTSHALDQHRVYGIPFSIAVLTNVTRDHLDYHKTYDNYLLTKARMFKMAKVIILNKDDESYEHLTHLNAIPKNKKVVTYGEENADVTLVSLKLAPFFKERFNQYNLLAAVSACCELAIPITQSVEYLKTFKRPVGRQEVVYSNDFSVMIDFAHTPNSFKELLSDIRRSTKGRIIHVFGVAGDRDKGKRSEMGFISSKYSDIIILTSEDPRHEAVEDICRQIESGIDPSFIEQTDVKTDLDSKSYIKIYDRKTAIKAAISLAEKGDYVVITGKGHEKSMNILGVETPWSDIGVVEELLKRHVK